MATSSPDDWRVGPWHPDLGDAQAELERLRALAKALLVKSPALQVTVECPEPGYLFLKVTRDDRTVAEVYCKDGDHDCYAVFVFTEEQEEVEHYCGTVGEAVEAIVPCQAVRASNGQR